MNTPKTVLSPIEQTLDAIRLSLIESNNFDDLVSMGIILKPSEFEHYIKYHSFAGHVQRLREFIRRLIR